jgi:hypothetical protein
MYKLVNFAKATDMFDPPDVIAECHQLKRLRKNVTEVSHMTEREKTFYNEKLKESEKRYRNFNYWTKVIQQ